MKLFIWEDVLKDYTSGMVVAYAKDIYEAIATIEQNHGKGVSEECLLSPCRVVCVETDPGPYAFVCWGGG